ncbi:ACT domain-containing protein [Klebsiella variicola subsp. variicola]|nr:ACT domain-containing protein [Klebsiella variicola subsp. variicola]
MRNRPGVLTAINQIFAAQSINIAAQYLQTSPQMGYVVIDIEAEEDVAQQALQAMKAIPGLSAPVCCSNYFASRAGRVPARFLLILSRLKFSSSRTYQLQVFPGVITAGNGISHCSLGRLSTCWQSCA